MECDQQVTFLIGAGVSVAVGMPTTTDITGAVLNDQFGIHSTGEVLYRPQQPNGLIDRLRFSTTCLYQKFLRGLRDRIRHQKLRVDGLAGTCVNYEDLYYIVYTLYEHLTGEAWDPLADEYWLQISDELPREVRSVLDSEGPSWLHCCLVFLRGAVAALLLATENNSLNLRRLRLFSQCARKAAKARVFTLNHDTVLERYLRIEGVSFYDGLAPCDGEIQWLDLEAYKRNKAPLHLYKLHGSTRWYPWRCNEDGQPVVQLGYSCSKALMPQDDKGRSWSRGGGPDPNSIILVGTLNKAASYQWPPFPKLLDIFVRILNNTCTLIICGHSLGDRFIRGHLANWLRGDPQRRIILIDPYASAIAQRINWTVLPRAITVVDKGIEAVDWGELVKHLHT